MRRCTDLLVPCRAGEGGGSFFDQHNDCLYRHLMISTVACLLIYVCVLLMKTTFCVKSGCNSKVKVGGGETAKTVWCESKDVALNGGR